MRQKEYIRTRVLKILNSKLPVPISSDSMCAMELVADLRVSEQDLQLIQMLMERMFCIVIMDEEMRKARTTNDILRLVNCKCEEVYPLISNQ